MKRLKVLVFEYITGGGLNKSDLPEALANEGLLMLQALIDNLAGTDAIDPLVMLDYRMVGRLIPEAHNIHIILPEHDPHEEFIRLMLICDAVWPIAPETDAILQTLCAEVERSGKLLLTSPTSAVNIAANKWLTYEALQRFSIATVMTQKLAEFTFSPGEWLIKPVDGVGCEGSYLFSDKQDFEDKTVLLGKYQYIVQPHLQGQKTSLSCLFKHGRGWLICANLQHFVIINQQYRLTGITVNFTSDTSKYLALVNDIANAMSDLWGYVGIDLIEIENQILVLEINPRLTTSFAGIQAACGINCASSVIELLAGEPQLRRSCNQPITIKIAEQGNHAN